MFTAHGEGSEFTLHRNREAFDWVGLVPRGAADVSSLQTATEVLGTRMAFPIMTSPCYIEGLAGDPEIAGIDLVGNEIK